VRVQVKLLSVLDQPVLQEAPLLIVSGTVCRSVQDRGFLPRRNSIRVTSGGQL